MEQELSQKLGELIELLRERNRTQQQFESTLLEELRVLNRTLSTIQMRETAGDL